MSARFQHGGEHGEGMGDLAELLLPHQKEFERRQRESAELLEAERELEEQREDEDKDEDESLRRPIQLAIVGRPNAGKSTLVNALLDEERVITGDKPGLTRDSIAVDWEYNGCVPDALHYDQACVLSCDHFYVLS